MKRRLFIKRAMITTAAASLVTGNASALSTTEIKKGTIIHSVYFWLKKDRTPEDEKSFLLYFELLNKIPVPKSLSFGKPAPTTPRPVTDNTFDYNLIIHFDSMDDIKKYESHPEHLKGAEAYAKYWERVQVRDTML